MEENTISRFGCLCGRAVTVAAAIAEPDGEVRSLRTIPNRVESIRNLIKMFGPAERMRGRRRNLEAFRPVDG